MGTSLLFLNILESASLYYKKDKRHHEMHRWQHMQRAVHMLHGDGDAVAEGGIRIACPPNYTLTLRNAPDNIPRVAPSTITVMGAATGGSSGALHAFNAFAGGGSGNGQNLHAAQTLDHMGIAGASRGLPRTCADRGLLSRHEDRQTLRENINIKYKDGK